MAKLTCRYGCYQPYNGCIHRREMTEEARRREFSTPDYLLSSSVFSFQSDHSPSYDPPSYSGGGGEYGGGGASGEW